MIGKRRNIILTDQRFKVLMVIIGKIQLQHQIVTGAAGLLPMAVILVICAPLVQREDEIQRFVVKGVADNYKKFLYGEDKMQQYREALRPYAKVWDEAMLTAALCFIRRELGIRDVFYHSYDTGNRLKGIERYYHLGKPPRYLYTELPKKFCFVPTSEAPDFLKPVRYLHYLQRHGKAQWFKLPTQEQAHGKKAAA